MDFNTFETYQAEIEYRSNRIRKDVGRHSSRRVRVPFVRRPAEATRTAEVVLRDDVGRLTVGARADLLLLDAPSHVHLAYRPGVPLVAGVWTGGRPVWS